MVGEDSPYISMHQFHQSTNTPIPISLADTEESQDSPRLGKEIPHYYQAGYQCCSRLPYIIIQISFFSFRACSSSGDDGAAYGKDWFRSAKRFCKHASKGVFPLSCAQNDSWVWNWLFLFKASSCSSPGNFSIGRKGDPHCYPGLWVHPLQALLSCSIRATCRGMFVPCSPITEIANIKTQRTRGLKGSKGRFTAEWLSVALV